MMEAGDGGPILSQVGMAIYYKEDSGEQHL